MQFSESIIVSSQREKNSLLYEVMRRENADLKREKKPKNYFFSIEHI